MENINVYSPVEDKNIQKNLNNSPIWKQAYHESELALAENKHNTLFHYVIKFDGLKPVQLNSVKRIIK